MDKNIIIETERLILRKWSLIISMKWAVIRKLDGNRDYWFPFGFW